MRPTAQQRLTGCTAPAYRQGADPNRGSRGVAYPSEIIPECRAKSSWNAERDQIGMLSDIIADSRATSLGIRIASINVKMATRLTNSQGIPSRLCGLMVVQVMGGRDCYDFVEGFIR